MTYEAAFEKRLFPRMPVTLTAHCRIGSRHVRDLVSDLSLGGLFLHTRERAKAGTAVRVALALPSQLGPRYCTLVGSVARSDRDRAGAFRGLAVSFAGEQIGAPDRLALERFCSSAGSGPSRSGCCAGREGASGGASAT